MAPVAETSSTVSPPAADPVVDADAELPPSPRVEQAAVPAPTLLPPEETTTPYGLTVRELLDSPPLAGIRLLAGEVGTRRPVQKVRLVEGRDVLAWAEPQALLLSSEVWFAGATGDLIRELDARGVAGLVLAPNRRRADLRPEIHAKAERLGMPVMGLPPGTAVEQVYTRLLAEVVDRHAAALARVADAHRALDQVVRTGGGLQDVADVIVRMLGAAVFITGPDGRVLASAGRPEELAAGRSTPPFDASGRLAAGPRSPGVYPAPAGRGWYAVMPVVAGPGEHARIIAFSERRKFGEDDQRALERTGAVAALALLRQRSVVAAAVKYQGDLLRDLVTGRVEIEQAVAAAAEAGWDLDRPVTVIVAEIDRSGGRWDGPDPRVLQERFATAWSTAIRAHDPQAAVGGYSQEVVAVVDAEAVDVAREAAARVRTTLEATLGADVTFTTGVSRAVIGAANLPAAYEQALRAVTVGRQVHGPGSVTDFNRLGVHRLLSLVPEGAELRAFVRETLGELAMRDDAETADLRQTLEVLLETNLNVAETARRLHFHYNTLRYRITKLEKMLGQFTEDAHLRLNLLLALEVVRMRGLSA